MSECVFVCVCMCSLCVLCVCAHGVGQKCDKENHEKLMNCMYCVYNVRVV